MQLWIWNTSGGATFHPGMAEKYEIITEILWNIHSAVYIVIWPVIGGWVSSFTFLFYLFNFYLN